MPEHTSDSDSSARNFMIYQRPTVQALNRWADEVDDQSWVSSLHFQTT